MWTYCQHCRCGCGGPAPFWRLTAAYDTFCVPLYPLLKFSPTQGRSWGLASWHCSHWFLCSLKPQPLGHNSSCQICDLVVDTGNFHASAVVGEGTDKRILLHILTFCSRGLLRPAPVQRLDFTDFRSVSISASFWEVLTEAQARSIGKLHWIVMVKLPKMWRDL